jgi:hypothetical protein
MTEPTLEPEVDSLVAELAALAMSETFYYSASLAGLRETDPFRRLVQLGESALPLLVKRVSRESFYLNDVILSIIGKSRADLGFALDASEEEIAEAFARYALVRIHLTAETTPSTLHFPTTAAISGAPPLAVAGTEGIANGIQLENMKQHLELAGAVAA